MFDWKSTYELKVPAIDRQHKNLFAVANELHVAMISGQGKNLVESILTRLVRYTKTHFHYEEELMKSCGYPDIEQHKEEHELLTRKVEDFVVEYKSGKEHVSIKLLQFLRGWLTDHIAGSDQKYAPYVDSDRAA